MDNGVFKIGIDAGYGDVKTVVNYDGQIESFKFPTAIAYAGDGFAFGSSVGKGEIPEYKYRDRTYRVGHPALNCPEIFSTKDISFLLSYAPLLIYVALKQIARVYNVSFSDLFEAEKRLCVGLPLANWEKYRSELMDTLTDFQVSENHAHLDNIEVLAQGQSRKPA